MNALFSKETINNNLSEKTEVEATPDEVTEVISTTVNKVPIVENKSRVTKKKRKKKGKAKKKKVTETRTETTDTVTQEVSANASITAQGDVAAQVVRKFK